VNSGTTVAVAEIVRFQSAGTDVTIRADGATTLLVMTGEPIREPVVGYGPFVMNSDAEIREAIADYNSGRFERNPRHDRPVDRQA
jgi:redox-sensitive bicupin YhaK (pirin superfamily)